MVTGSGWVPSLKAGGRGRVKAILGDRAVRELKEQVSSQGFALVHRPGLGRELDYGSRTAG